MQKESGVSDTNGGLLITYNFIPGMSEKEPLVAGAVIRNLIFEDSIGDINTLASTILVLVSYYSMFKYTNLKDCQFGVAKW